MKTNFNFSPQVHKSTSPFKFSWAKMMTIFAFFMTSCGEIEKVEIQKENQTSLEKRTGSCATQAYQNICTNQAPQTVTKELDSIPGYPSNCKFTVEFTYVECNWVPDPNYLYYVIGEFKLISVNCAQYDSEIDDVLFNPGIGIPTLEDYMNNLYDKLFTRLEDLVFEPFKEQFDCDFPTDLFYLKWIKTSCSRYCAFRTGGEGSYIATPLGCGTGCCAKFSQMCWDSVNRKIIKTITTSETQQGECDPPSTPTPSGCIQASPCKFECE